MVVEPKKEEKWDIKSHFWYIGILFTTIGIYVQKSSKNIQAENQKLEQHILFSSGINIYKNWIIDLCIFMFFFIAAFIFPTS